MSLESQLRQAFSEFSRTLSALQEQQSFARERELVTWFTIGALLPQVAEGEVLSDPLQVGIEVACPQRVTDTNRRKHPDVCKDIVIWPRPYDVTWDEDGLPSHAPLAVIEWKVPVRKDSPSAETRKRSERDGRDHAWLAWFVNQGGGAEAYSVWCNLRVPGPLEVCRFTKGEMNAAWFTSADG